jgi:urea transport system ATP-binding protein
VSALVVEKLHVRYGAVHAVRGLSLDVQPGEIVGLIGPNGAGKSSTLHAIMGAAPVVDGDVRLGGRSLVGRSSEDVARSGIALVPEGRRIFGELTVEENLRLGLAARRTPGDGFARVFDLFPVIRDMRGRTAGALSGGQQQQLAIARALVAQPSLLVLDEPTEGIQPSIIKDIGRAITYLREQGKMAILLVEQYFDFARALADSFAVMERGEIVMAGTGASMVESDVRRYLTV